MVKKRFQVLFMIFQNTMSDHIMFSMQLSSRHLTALKDLTLKPRINGMLWLRVILFEPVVNKVVKIFRKQETALTTFVNIAFRLCCFGVATIMSFMSFKGTLKSSKTEHSVH